MIKLELEKNIGIDKKQYFFLSVIFLFFIITPIIIFGSYLFLVSAPYDFPLGKVIDIKKGSSLKSIGDQLEADGIINSSKLFTLGRYRFNDITMKAGKYSFDKEIDTWEVFKKISNGEGIIPDDIKFTIHEGDANYIIARNISKVMKNIEEDDFIAAAKKYEGELYPNTYRLNIDADAESVVNRFKSEFNRQLEKYNIKISDKDRNEILTKASLIESEAGIADYQTKRHIAGIINNRLNKGMLLQIDAVFFYIFKDNIKNRVIRNSHLKVDSKYNTYKYPGLPPGPISNPSIDSIRAALDPMENKDLYYITGCDGIFYYARTGIQHNLNKQKYLKNKTYCSKF